MPEAPVALPVETQVFRPQGWLRASTHLGLLLWLSIGVHMAVTTGLTAQAVGGIAFFLVLFTTIEVLHARTWIAVDPDRLRVRDPARQQEIAFSEVLRVDVDPGVLQTSYTIVLRRGFVSFTSFFGEHRRLCQLIVERARLDPSR